MAINYAEKKIRTWIVASMCLLFAIPAFAVDTDADGIADAVDNCLLEANLDQRDTNDDGYGNICDADFDNNGISNFADLVIFSQWFLQVAPYVNPLGDDVDMNGDGVVNFGDLYFFKQKFLLPPGPSAIDDVFDQNAAARFLTQATFGATASEIQALAQSGDTENWINTQIAIPFSSHEILTRQFAERMCFDLPSNTDFDGYYSEARQAAWWKIALIGQDQLRQRVAFALSEIVVASDRVEQLAGSQYGMASYYDMLAQNAFGNYRDILQQVSLHPVMGIYLSMVRNERPQPALNIRPDENYARELLQLFTIGVHELNLNGTKILDTQGNPIPTYTQADIEQFARVFTGWNYAGLNWYQWFAESDRTQPMVPFEQFHDTDAKTLLNGVQIPGGQTALQDLNDALDNVFAHQNLAPFISRQLIQRLVTSSPTPEYIARVASKFNNNGSNVRGDLKAVVSAILMDPEARQGHVYWQNRFGKLREPLLRLSHVRRTFDATPVQKQGHRWDGQPCGQPAWEFYPIPFGQVGQALGQQAQNAPSVFNFFFPDYAPPGEVRDSGLVAPEFQLFTTSTATSTAKTISFEIQNNQIWGPGWVELDLSVEIGLAANPEDLLDYLNILLMSGQMSVDMRGDILAHLYDPSLPGDSTLNEVRARDAVMLIMMSPDYLIQR